MNKDGKFSFGYKMQLPTQMKILTMAIKKQLENMVFLSNKNHLQSFYCSIYF